MSLFKDMNGDSGMSGILCGEPWSATFQHWCEPE